MCLGITRTLPIELFVAIVATLKRTALNHYVDVPNCPIAAGLTSHALGVNIHVVMRISFSSALVINRIQTS